MLAEVAALAAAHVAAHVHLAAGLGEGEEVRAVARLAILAKHALNKVVERALKIAKGDALVDDQALDLVELRQVAGVGRVGTVDGTRADHVDGRLLRLHGVDLHARGLGAQQHVGLAVGVSLGVRDAAGVVVDHVEGIAGRAARVIHGRVERGEVVVGSIDHGAGLDGVADAAKDVLGLLDDLLDQVLVTDLRTDARQRDVDGLVLECVLEGGGLHLGGALVEHALDQLAHLVGALAHHGTILGGELAHHAHQAGDAALAAEQLNARGLELCGVVGACDELLGLFLEFDQIINQTHVFPFVSRTSRLPGRLAPDSCGCAARFGNKKPPSGMYIAQGRLNSAVPPCLTRRMSGPPRPLCAPCREAHGFPTGASLPLAARPLRSLLGSERLALATAGRLAAHDLPSLAGDTAGKTLSVNALGYRITHFASASPRSVLFALGTRQVAVQTGRAPACGARPARLRIRHGKETR